MSEFPQGKEAIQKHFQKIFFDYPITVISLTDQLIHLGLWEPSASLHNPTATSGSHA